MKLFTSLLKKINDRLILPQPLKSRILIEMAGDMDDLYEFYRKKGLNEKEAIQKTEEKFDMTDEALSELLQVHQSVFRKAMNRISEQAQTRWERTFLAVILLLIAVFSGREILSIQFFLQASKFIWPILVFSFVIIILSLVEFYNLYIKKDHNIKKLRSLLHSILFLGGLSLFTGILGYFIEFYSAENYRIFLENKFSIILIPMGMPESDKILIYISDWMIKCSSMIMVSMLVTIFSALIWFILNNKIVKIEQAEAAFLLEE